MSRPGETYQDAQLTYHNLGYNVKFKIEIENHTSENIETISILPNIGYVKTKPPQVIAAGMKECMVGHKVSMYICLLVLSRCLLFPIQEGHRNLPKVLALTLKMTRRVVGETRVLVRLCGAHLHSVLVCTQCAELRKGL